MRWFDGFLRLTGVFLGAGGVLGFVWFFDTARITSFAIPLSLLALSVTPRRQVGRHWLILFAALSICLLDIVLRGLPLVRPYAEIDVEVLSAVQLTLLAYFAIRGLIGADEGPVTYLRNLLP